MSRALFHLVRADVLERVRRYSYLLMLGFAVYLGYTVAAGYWVMHLGDYTGIANGAWIGCLTAMVTTTMLTVFGFYLVKGSVERDRRTGVGQILATTPISKSLYTLGKVLSNFAVLTTMVGVLALVAVFLVVFVAKVELDLWKVLSPFLFISLPAMAFIAALAVVFETLPGLRGGGGNVLYLFFWAGLLMLGPIAGLRWIDLASLLLVSQSLEKALVEQHPDAPRGVMSLNITDRLPPESFVWSGFDWTAGEVMPRLAWFAVGLGLSFLAALFFDRFDPSRERRRTADAPTDIDARPTIVTVATGSPQVVLTPLDRAVLGRSGTVGLLLAELRLMLARRSLIWYAGVAGLLIAAFAVPLENVRYIVLPLTWIWPVLVWSSLGSREMRHGTEQIVFSTPGPLRRHLPVTILAALLVTLGTASGVLIRLLVAGDLPGVGAILCGSVFIVGLAFALGVWTRSSKAFEVIYTVVWYVGAGSHVVPFDYLGATQEAVESGFPVRWLVFGVVLLAVAFPGRTHQIRR